VLVCLIVASGPLWFSAKARLAFYLDVSDTTSEKAIEADLCQRFPLGTSIQDVRDTLERGGLRQGGGATRYYLSKESGLELQDIEKATAIACVFDYNTGILVFGREYYYVWFLFDEKKRLESVKVKCGVTDL